jgi:hypothetical protein
MDYVKIPQNVRVEDKLIGPLSLKQIIVVALGGGVSYALFAMVKKMYGSVPMVAHAFVWIPLILCLAFALVRINDISLMRYVLLSFELMVKPRKRVWQPRRGLNILPRAVAEGKKSKKKQKEEEEALVQEKAASLAAKNFRLGDLSVLLDRGGQAISQPVAGTGVVAGAEVAISDTDVAEHTAEEKRIDALWREMKKTAHPSSVTTS